MAQLILEFGLQILDLRTVEDGIQQGEDCGIWKVKRRKDNRRFHGYLSGYDNDEGCRKFLTDEIHDLIAVDVRQPDILQNEIDRVLIQKLNRLFATIGSY